MTLKKRLQLSFSACVAALAFAGSALAAAPQALTPDDAQRYAAAFEACDRGDFIGAQMQAVEIKDKSLLGYLSFSQLMHPSAHKASFDELSGWMAKFRDLPLAERVFALAAKRAPADAPLPQPVVTMTALDDVRADAGSPELGRQAREAFYSGNPAKALELAPAAGDRWIAGLAAFRLKAFDEAQTHFKQLAGDQTQDPWLRAAAAFWGSRSAQALGDATSAAAQLQIAAASPQTFYGMIAERQLRLHAPALAAAAEAPARLVRAAFVQPSDQIASFISAEPRAHRAAALAQIGRLTDAGQEIRAGMTLARTEADRSRWVELAAALGAPIAAVSTSYATKGVPTEDYPLPALEPKSGFTVDKALVYAIVRQESRFNPQAVSPVGAIGLMQLMPESAARAVGDDKLKSDPAPLFDAAFNLRAGQDYLSWLMDRGVGYDLLRTVAAYNGGPGAVLKTAQMLGGEARDPLLMIESLPAQETRNYVEKVVAAYWTYKKMFGEETRTLDAVAGGATLVDTRLDINRNAGAGLQLSASDPIGALLN